MRYIPNQEGRAEAALRAVLPRSVVIVATTRRDGGADLVVGGLAIEARWVGEGRLADIRSILAEANRHPGLVVVARRMSPGARDALSAAAIGWADEAGAAEIALGFLIVSRTGRAEGPPKKVDRWTPSVVAVAEALLCGTRATVNATTAATGLSTGSCIAALRTLTTRGLLRSDVSRGPASARTVIDRQALLQAYATAAQAQAPKLSLRAGVSWRDMVTGVLELGRKWEAAQLAWAATGTVAATVLAPHLTSVNAAEVFVDANTPAALEAAGALCGLRAMEGGRLLLRPFPTMATRQLSRDVEGLRVAPWPRVYVDLQNVGVRGEEAAEHLREVMHG